MSLADPARLDRMYNNRALVPAHPDHLTRWAADSAMVRAAYDCVLDQRYGAGPNETLDIFPSSASRAPVLMLIHGGYWRALDKSDHSFIAPAFTRAGACVVVPNYALCPGTPEAPVTVPGPEAPVTVPGIVMQMVRAIAWTWRCVAQFGGDPQRIVVAGHSVGGHMAAMLLACRWAAIAPDLPPHLVRSALAVSGLYELKPLRRAPFLASVGLTARDVARASPARWPPPCTGRLYSVAGGDESAEFQRQNRLIRARWGASAVPVCELVAGLNHFSIVDALAQPSGRLHELALDLLGLPVPDRSALR